MFLLLKCYCVALYWFCSCCFGVAEVFCLLRQVSASFGEGLTASSDYLCSVFQCLSSVLSITGMFCLSPACFEAPSKFRWASGKALAKFFFFFSPVYVLSCIGCWWSMYPTSFGVLQRELIQCCDQCIGLALVFCGKNQSQVVTDQCILPALVFCSEIRSNLGWSSFWRVFDWPWSFIKLSCYLF